jgi:chromate transporter
MLFRTQIGNPPPADTSGKNISSGNSNIAADNKTTSKPVILALTASLPFTSFNVVASAKLFVTFAGMSLLLFGGGYVFIPLMQQSVVDGYGWVTRQEFIDAIALGQVTPGPILISSAFIGYKVSGLSGAAAATAGIFAPPALLMITSSHFLKRINSSNGAKAVLRGIRSVVIGMIVVAALKVAQSSTLHILSLVIFAATLIALLRYKVEIVWIIPIAGAAGFLFY